MNWPEKTFISLYLRTDVDLGIAVFYGGQCVHGWDWNMTSQTVQILRRCREDKVPLVVWNAGAQIPLIRNLIVGGGYLWHNAYNVIDPFVIDQHYAISVAKSPWRKFILMAHRYGLSTPSKGEALHNATLAGYLALGVAKHHPTIGRMSPLDLHRNEAYWIKDPNWPWEVEHARDTQTEKEGSTPRSSASDGERQESGYLFASGPGEADAIAQGLGGD